MAEPGDSTPSGAAFPGSLGRRPGRGWPSPRVCRAAAASPKEEQMARWELFSVSSNLSADQPYYAAMHYTPTTSEDIHITDRDAYERTLQGLLNDGWGPFSTDYGEFYTRLWFKRPL